MTDHAPRLYALTIAVLGFFVAWAVIAAHPWKVAASTVPAPSPVVARLTAYEQRLLRDSALVDRLVRKNADRVAAAHAASVQAAASRAIAVRAAAVRRAAPVAPRIVYLPPLTVTRTS